jgi:endonuclease/exonuclease/phosphatase family metal-dependent hydrolase
VAGVHAAAEGDLHPALIRTREVRAVSDEFPVHHIRRATATVALLLAFVGAGASSAAGPSPPGEFVAVTLNLWHDQADWPARQAVILDSLRALAPDVVFLQEVIQRETLPNQARTLADSLGYSFVFTSVDPVGASKRYGNAILTRHRILETHEVKLEPLDDYRVAAHALLDVGGRNVDVYVTHLHHTSEGSGIRAVQVRHLLEFIEATRKGGALLLGGDFNAAPNAPELGPIRERLADAFAAVHPELVGVSVTTLNTAMGHTPQRIDTIFANPGGLQPLAAEVFLDTPAPGGVWASDHFGVWARFVWPP